MTMPRPVPAAWPAYIGQQVADWFDERGLVPIIRLDIDDPSVQVMRIHGAAVMKPVPVALCGSVALYRCADLSDLCSWLPCRSCTRELCNLIQRGLWR